MKPSTMSTIAPCATRLAALTLAASLTASALQGCHEAPPPATPAAPIEQPRLQGKSLSFPANHPHLALIGLSEAQASRNTVAEMPAKLVWNEERTQRVYPAFAGRVLQIRADVGQAVRPGSVLAQLGSPDFGQAQSDAARAQTDLRQAQRTLQRQRELLEAGIVARKDFEQAEADLARAQAEADRAQQRTALYGGGSGVNQQLALTAGLQGVVVERNLNPGQELRPDQSGPGTPALFTISDPSSLWVQIDAREAEFGVLKPGSSFDLVVPVLPGQRFSGKVVAVSDFIDPSTRTVKIRGVVANPQRLLKAEMLATARAERQFEGGVMVPASAVLLRGSEHAVFVQTTPGTFERREVELAYEGSKEVVLKTGVKAGEKVVTDNVLLIARMLANAMAEAGVPASSDRNAKASAQP